MLERTIGESGLAARTLVRFLPPARLLPTNAREGRAMCCTCIPTLTAHAQGPPQLATGPHHLRGAAAFAGKSNARSRIVFAAARARAHARCTRLDPCGPAPDGMRLHSQLHQGKSQEQVARGAGMVSQHYQRANWQQQR